MSELEQLDVPTALLGESPRWDHVAGVFYWVDIMAGEVRRYDPVSGAYATMQVGQLVGAVVTRASGGLAFAVQEGFAVAPEFGGPVSLVAAVEQELTGNRMNDGACDSSGRFYAGTMALEDNPGAGSLYRLDPDGTVTKLVENVTVSNGIGWSLDESTMYYVDTSTGRIDAFSYAKATGKLAMRRLFATIPEGNGMPDGLTVDDEGAVWVALWGGGGVLRFLPDGTLDRRIDLPVRHVTSCAFGGADLEDLYITTASRTIAGDEGTPTPEEGGLFRCRPGVKGLPSHSFGG